MRKWTIIKIIANKKMHAYNLKNYLEVKFHFEAISNWLHISSTVNRRRAAILLTFKEALIHNKRARLIECFKGQIDWIPITHRVNWAESTNSISRVPL